jgi:uncharacterized protein YndB with AHSA1/START domain
MTETSAEHATFTIERRYPTPPARVFAAWSDPEAKRRWWLGRPEEWERVTHELDFRVGGREVNTGSQAGGLVHTFNGLYWDIVPDERIVYSFEMLLDERRISVSLTTVQLSAEGDGTRLVYTEQCAFLDGFEPEGPRRDGMGALLDALGEMLGSSYPRP